MITKLLYHNWKRAINSANKYGVPLPTVRDPKTGLGSISLTLVFLSSILVMVGLVGKWSKIAGEIDMNNAMEFLYASCALYFGRQWQMKSGTKIEGSLQDGEDPTQTPPPPQQ